MSWFSGLSGSYTNWEAPGHALNQVGDRWIAGFNAYSIASSASVIGASNVSVVGYAIGPITSNYVTPAMGAANTEIYGIIPRGGSQPYPGQAKLIDSASAGPGYVYNTDSSGSENQIRRQVFRIANQIGERYEVPYASHADSSPSVGGRVVCGGAGSVKRASAKASASSDQTVAAGQMFSNWICIALDTTNKYCIIEKVG